MSDEADSELREQLRVILSRMLQGHTGEVARILDVAAEKLTTPASVSSMLPALDHSTLLSVADRVLWSLEENAALLEAYEDAAFDASSAISLQDRRWILDGVFSSGLRVPGRMDWADFAARLQPDVHETAAVDSRQKTVYDDIRRHMDSFSDWSPFFLVRQLLRWALRPDDQFIRLIEGMLAPGVRSSEDASAIAERLRAPLANARLAIESQAGAGGAARFRVVPLKHPVTTSEGSTMQTDPLASLARRVERLKALLVDHLTKDVILLPDGPSLEEAEFYRRVRQELRESVSNSSLPHFVVESRTVDEALSAARAGGGASAVVKALNALVDLLEAGGPAAMGRDYEIHPEPIGRGGFAEVFRVTNKLLGYDFALKVFGPMFADSSGSAAARFYREAKVLFRLDHPNIVKVYDVHSYAGRPAIRMELLDGQSLDKTLKAGQRLAPVTARKVIVDVLRGLQHAHDDVRVLHRDVHPRNIMILLNGRAKLLDFGLSAFLDDTEGTKLTSTGNAIGPGGHYEPPERDKTPMFDLYSVGACWYAALVGGPPGGVEALQRLDELGLLPAERAIILRLLKHRPEERYGSAGDALDAIRSLAPPSPPQPEEAARAHATRFDGGPSCPRCLQPAMGQPPAMGGNECGNCGFLSDEG